MTNPENFNDNTRGGFSVKANPRPLRLGGKCGDKRSSRLTPCCDPSHPCYRQGRPDHCNFDFCLSGALDESDPAFILTASESSAADEVASSTIADGKVYMQFKDSPASLANSALTDSGGDITDNKVTNPADSYLKIPEVAMGASVDMACSPGTKVAGDLDMAAHILPVETGAANTTVFGNKTLLVEIANHGVTDTTSATTGHEWPNTDGTSHFKPNGLLGAFFSMSS